MQVAYPARMAKSPSYVGPRFQRRKHWLNVLVAENGGPKAVASAVETPDTYITAMCKGNRGVGDEIADRLERKFSKPNGWLDQALDAEADTSAASTVTLQTALSLLGAAIEGATDSQAKAAAHAMLLAYIQAPALNADMVPLIIKRLSGELSEEPLPLALTKQA